MLETTPEQEDARETEEQTERNSDAGNGTWMEADVTEDEWNVESWSQVLISNVVTSEPEQEAEHGLVTNQTEPINRAPKRTIFTDSESLVRALENNKTTEKHEWMGKIKEELGKMETKVNICWIPSHCDVAGNEKADQLAEEGTRKPQEEAPVTEGIMRAKIKNKKWIVKREDVAKTFGERRKPDEVEKTWPENVRRCYNKLRSGHAKELRSYRKKIEIEEIGTCTRCQLGEDETIEHVLCRCELLEARRISMGCTEITVEWLTKEAEICRKLLEGRFKQLRLPHEIPETSPKTTEGGGKSGNGQKARADVWGMIRWCAVRCKKRTQ